MTLLFEVPHLDLNGLNELAQRLARALVPGDLVLLHGPLGSGKTALVRLVARALGVRDPVRSPSFTLANVYSGGPITVNHLDLFRLEGIGEQDTLALEEYVEPESITLIEWPEAGLGRLGEPAFVIELEHATERTRRVRVLTPREEARKRWEAAT